MLMVGHNMDPNTPNGAQYYANAIRNGDHVPDPVLSRSRWDSWGNEVLIEAVLAGSKLAKSKIAKADLSNPTSRAAIKTLIEYGVHAA